MALLGECHLLSLKIIFQQLANLGRPKTAGRWPCGPCESGVPRFKRWQKAWDEVLVSWPSKQFQGSD